MTSENRHDNLAGAHYKKNWSMQLFDSSNYQPQAATVFAAVADEVSRLLPDAQIEHIGASAIPSAVSKGDLDLCVLVAPQAHAQTVQALEAAGYAIKADTLPPVPI